MPEIRSPQAFVAKWRDVTLKERSSSQEHFIDLCRLLGHPTPAEFDPMGERFTFERGADKQTGGQGVSTAANATAIGHYHPTKAPIPERIAHPK
jgi:hypothetical protein